MFFIQIVPIEEQNKKQEHKNRVHGQVCGITENGDTVSSEYSPVKGTAWTGEATSSLHL